MGKKLKMAVSLCCFITYVDLIMEFLITIPESGRLYICIVHPPLKKQKTIHTLVYTTVAGLSLSFSILYPSNFFHIQIIFLLSTS